MFALIIVTLVLCSMAAILNVAVAALEDDARGFGIFNLLVLTLAIITLAICL